MEHEEEPWERLLASRRGQEVSDEDWPKYLDRVEAKAQGRRRRNRGLAREIVGLRDQGLTYRQIAERLGVSLGQTHRLEKYGRKRAAVEARAPLGAVEWAESLTCPECGMEGMEWRVRARDGVGFAGCSMLSEYRCRGSVSWEGPMTRQPDPEEALADVDDLPVGSSPAARGCLGPWLRAAPRKAEPVA